MIKFYPLSLAPPTPHFSDFSSWLPTLCSATLDADTAYFSELSPLPMPFSLGLGLAFPIPLPGLHSHVLGWASLRQASPPADLC